MTLEITAFFNKDTFLIFGVLLLLALSALLSERSGIINIALEGQLIAGVLGYTLVGFYLNGTSLPDFSIYLINVFSAILFVLVLTLFFAFFVVYLRLNQILVALALNVIMYGLASFVIVSLKDNTSFYLEEDYIWLYFSKNFSPYLTIDALSLSIFYPALFLIFFLFLIHFFLFRTKVGLRIRSCGENPSVARNNGLSVSKYQYLALMLGGILIGFSATFYAEWKSSFSGGTNGIGYLGLAMLILGMRNVWLIAFFVLFFSVLKTFVISFVSDDFQELINTINYVFPFLVLMFSKLFYWQQSGRYAVPQALGQQL